MIVYKNKLIYKKTRPDTRPPVADGLAGAEMRVFPFFDSWVTDQRTDGWADKASYRVACPQLKITQKFMQFKWFFIFQILNLPLLILLI